MATRSLLREKGRGQMTAIFFIIDGAGLEAQAALLAATLAHHNGQRFRLIAYVPDRHRPHLEPARI